MTSRRILAVAGIIVLAALCVPAVVIGLYVATHSNPDPRDCARPSCRGGRSHEQN